MSVSGKCRRQVRIANARLKAIEILHSPLFSTLICTSSFYLFSDPGDTDIWGAAASGDTARVTALLDGGVDVDSKSKVCFLVYMTVGIVIVPS